MKTIVEYLSIKKVNVDDINKVSQFCVIIAFGEVYKMMTKEFEKHVLWAPNKRGYDAIVITQKELMEFLQKHKDINLDRLKAYEIPPEYATVSDFQEAWILEKHLKNCTSYGLKGFKEININDFI